MADWAINILKSEGVTELNLESFSMGSTSGQATYDIGAHSGILYMKIHEAGIKVNFIPPTTNKKAFFGMGNAGKPEMCEKFYQVHGARFYEILGTKQYETPENDMVDAYSIAHCDVRLDEKAAKKMFM
ncbi:hypothetical protein SHAb15599_00184 [Acinetobacter phage SH-Ab 15599]|nr:hypothetical protein SHAb15599_00184 [Acinetobacter phage SH-Ab 15599]